MTAPDLLQVAKAVKDSARALGFSDCRVSDLDLGEAPQRLRDWLAEGRHGSMDYMARHADLRADPAQLVPGALRAICVRLDYQHDRQPQGQAWQARAWQRIQAPGEATVSLYALGRDYHKAVRQRLQQLADAISQHVPHQYRVFSDSAPVMEVALATQAGLGWRGKHTLLLSREGGSMFFLGEILTDCPLPLDEPTGEHCGSCQACIDICPTQAITGPYQLDARRCISYLTIEHRGSIPEDLRPLMGNRIYGCDDCQLACPWNKYAQVARVPDFAPRNGLDASTLVQLFAWTEEEFNRRLEGSAIRRIGHAQWLRNIAVALGNGAATPEALGALQSRATHDDPLVREHVAWALARLQGPQS
ncbi:MAG TPA: tRNA epoxyqueuosine(34) reductase QueG [Burkholderiaceae bacterium]|nr:tRNA epoxyqueuosine(34) reductase QueG [Burkholderiaceae bacterium]